MHGAKTKWKQSGQLQLTTEEMVLYFGHEENSAPHTKGVALLLMEEAQKALIGQSRHLWRRILRNHRPETISNENLWARALQTPVEGDIRGRKWKWLRHTLRKPPGCIAVKSWTGTPRVNKREGDHVTPGNGSLKRILKGLDTHGNNLKGQRRTEETGELLLVAYAPGGVKGQSK